MTGSVRGPQLARLLGQWHPLPGRRRSPDYLALAGSVRGLLSDGRLPLGVRLPAERELAEALTISRTTVTAAYRDLRESGHLTSRRGAGSWTALPAGGWPPRDCGPRPTRRTSSTSPAPPRAHRRNWVTRWPRPRPTCPATPW